MIATARGWCRDLTVPRNTTQHNNLSAQQQAGPLFLLLARIEYFLLEHNFANFYFLPTLQVVPFLFSLVPAWQAYVLMDDGLFYLAQSYFVMDVQGEINS